MTQVVELDGSLKDLQPWPEVARTLREAMRHPGYDGVTIVLRAMNPEDWRLLLDNREEAQNDDPAREEDGRNFEFVFDLKATDYVPPPDRWNSMREWVECVILRRVQRHLEGMETSSSLSNNSSTPSH